MDINHYDFMIIYNPFNIEIFFMVNSFVMNYDSDNLLFFLAID